MMNNKTNFIYFFVVLMLPLLIFGCVATGSARRVDTPQTVAPQATSDGVQPDSTQVATATAMQPLEAYPVKIGSPYTVRGVKYYPMPSAPAGYTERGVASWYGDDFHGKQTSNGEIYNMHAMTAAHKTLPIPTYVQVRNLDNGRETIVRINDRGPFSKGRIIDLSYAAANQLGMISSGVARVEITVLAGPNSGAPALTQTIAPDAGKTTPNQIVDPGTGSGAALVDAPIAVDDIPVRTPEVVDTPANTSVYGNYNVQILSSSDESAAANIASGIANAIVVRAVVDGQVRYRVQVTGYETEASARSAASEFSSQYPGAFIVAN